MGQTASVRSLNRTETIIVNLVERIESLEKSNVELKRVTEDSRKQIKTLNVYINDINFELRNLAYKK